MIQPWFIHLIAMQLHYSKLSRIFWKLLIWKKRVMNDSIGKVLSCPSLNEHCIDEIETMLSDTLGSYFNAQESWVKPLKPYLGTRTQPLRILLLLSSSCQCSSTKGCQRKFLFLRFFFNVGLYVSRLFNILKIHPMNDFIIFTIRAIYSFFAVHKCKFHISFRHVLIIL